MEKNDFKIKSNFKVSVRDDGIFLINENAGRVAASIKSEVLKSLAEMGVTEIDLSAVDEVISSEEKDFEKKISDNTDSIKHDSDVVVEVSRDRMEAFVKLFPAGIMGRVMTLERLKERLDDNGVKFGINEKKLEEIINTKRFNERIKIADGVPAKDGENGSLELKIDINAKSNKPKEMDDGRVDYKQISFFQGIKVGQLLAVSFPPKPGIDGTNVLGQVVSYKPGRPSPKLPKGKGTDISPDGTKLLATISGQIDYSDNKINILPILDIPGDINNSTGNIVFDGAVIVRGAVMSGFSIRATGFIEVKGMVEGAQLESDEDIQLFSGVQGVEKAVIKAKGNIFVKFAQNCTLIADGDIVSDSIMHCNVKCDGSLILSGRKCLLAGGNISVTHKIAAKVIGSTMATQTEIYMGNPPKLLERYNNLTALYEQTKVHYEKLAKLAETVLKAGNITQLPLEKKILLQRAMQDKVDLRKKMEEIQKELAQVIESMEAERGEIAVQEVIHPGVKVTIGNAVMYVRDDISRCILRNRDSRIVIDTF